MTNGLMFPSDEHVYITGKPTGTENSTFVPPSVRTDDLTFYGQATLSMTLFDPVEFSLTGTPIDSFFDDWYNRIHLMPSTIDLLNVISDQTRTITLWNAYLVNKTLTSTVFPEAQGLTVDSPVTPPYVLRALETLEYNG
jgi:hypothetical protein